MHQRRGAAVKRLGDGAQAAGGRVRHHRARQEGGEVGALHAGAGAAPATAADVLLHIDSVALDTDKRVQPELRVLARGGLKVRRDAIGDEEGVRHAVLHKVVVATDGVQVAEEPEVREACGRVKLRAGGTGDGQRTGHERGARGRGAGAGARAGAGAGGAQHAR